MQQPSNGYGGPPYGHPQQWGGYGQAQPPYSHMRVQRPPLPHQNHHQTHAQAGPPEPQSCFNCGQPDHWAQHCPEPRRAVPAGSLKQGTNFQPQRRQKHIAPVITRYGAPPTQPQQHGYGPGPHGLPTPGPLPTHPQLHQAWQQQFPAGHPQAAYHPYAPQGVPTPQTPFESPFPRPVSAQSRPGQPGFYGPHAPPNAIHQAQAAVPFGGTPQHSPSAGFSPVQEPPPQSHQRPHHAQQPVRPPREPPISRSQSLSAQSNASHDSNPDVETYPPSFWDFWPWLDTKTKPAKRVQLCLLSAASHPEAWTAYGESNDTTVRSCSRLLASDDRQTRQGVRDAERWTTMKDDPVFRKVRQDCERISLDELIANRGWRRVQDTETALGKEDDDAAARSRERGMNQHDDGSPAWDHIQERAVDNGEVSGRSETEPELLSKSPGQPTEQVGETTEERLARLGVTGIPKPVVISALMSRSEGSERGRSPSAGHVSRGRSRSPSAADHPAAESSLNGNGNVQARYREREPISPHHGSNMAASPGARADGRDVRFSSSQNGSRHDGSQPRQHSGRARDLPPPPPPPSRKRSHDGAAVSPTSDSSRENYFRTSHKHLNGGYGHDGRDKRRRSASPGKEDTFEREEDYYRRSREVEARKEPRRQVDDVTPKRKASQPRVAEAFSRRW